MWEIFAKLSGTFHSMFLKLSFKLSRVIYTVKSIQSPLMVFLLYRISNEWSTVCSKRNSIILYNYTTWSLDCSFSQLKIHVYSQAIITCHFSLIVNVTESKRSWCNDKSTSRTGWNKNSLSKFSKEMNFLKELSNSLSNIPPPPTPHYM